MSIIDSNKTDKIIILIYLTEIESCIGFLFSNFFDGIIIILQKNKSLILSKGGEYYYLFFVVPFYLMTLKTKMSMSNKIHK